MGILPVGSFSKVLGERVLVSSADDGSSHRLAICSDASHKVYPWELFQESPPAGEGHVHRVLALALTSLCLEVFSRKVWQGRK